MKGFRKKEDKNYDQLIKLVEWLLEFAEQFKEPISVSFQIKKGKVSFQSCNTLSKQINTGGLTLDDIENLDGDDEDGSWEGVHREIDSLEEPESYFG